MPFTILIVEDNKTLNKIIGASLIREGFNVKSVFDANSAIDFIKNNQNVFLVLDYQLPDLSGNELIVQLRKEGHYVPFIIITAHADVKIIIEMMRLGARDCIEKDSNFIDNLVNQLIDSVTKLREERKSKEFEYFLIENESRHHQLFAKIPDIVLVIQDERIVYCNAALERITGFGLHEIISQSANFIIDKKSEHIIAEILEYRNSESSIPDNEIQFRTKTGELKTGILKTEPTIFNKRYALLAVIIDITSRKKIEDAFVLNENRYRILAENMEDVVWSMNDKLQITYISPSILKFENYDIEYAIVTSINEFRAKESKFVIQKIAKKNNIPAEFDIAELHHEFIWLETKITYIKNKYDDTIGIIGVSRDVSERIALEISEKKANRFVNLVLANVNQGVIVYDKKFRIKLWNKYMERLTRYPAKVIVGKTASEPFPYLLENGTVKLFENALNGQFVKDYEMYYIDEKTHRTMYYSCSFAPYYNEDRQIDGVVCTINNITEKKNYEIQLEEERKKTLSSFYDGQENEKQRISREIHDGIGQKLVVIKMQLQNSICLKDDKLKENIKTALIMCADTINEVRQISHDLSPSSLNELGLPNAVRQLCGEVERISKMKVEFISHCINEANSDRVKNYLYRIAQELISNGLKHSKANQIIIQLLGNKKQLSLIYRDDGIGFDSKLIPKQKGIGLYNVIQRVDLLGGSYYFDTQTDKGSIIRIIVPINEVKKQTIST